MVRWRRAGLEAAFLEATQPAADLVYNLARRLTATTADAEDLVQETYLHAWRAWAQGTRPRRVEPWLATICLNAGRDRARHAVRHPEVPLGERTGTAPDPADRAVVRLDVEAALARLSEPARIAVILSDVCGLRGREVARVTDCPLGTALARIHRGRRAIAAQLEAADPTEPSTSKPRRGGETDAP